MKELRMAVRSSLYKKDLSSHTHEYKGIYIFHLMYWNKMYAGSRIQNKKVVKVKKEYSLLGRKLRGTHSLW